MFHSVAVSSRRVCATVALRPPSAPSRGSCADTTVKILRTRNSSTVSPPEQFTLERICFISHLGVFVYLARQLYVNKKRRINVMNLLVCDEV